jgi:O-antigen ligase
MLLVIGGGLFASVSRGPWLGAVLLVGVFLLLGRGGGRKVVQFGLAGVLALALMAMTPAGKNIIELLPFIGSTRSETVDYRVDLIEAARKTFSRNPWFGTTDPLRYPEMQAMIQGQGIIDLVNSYIQVGLYSGTVGLTLFLLSIVWPVRRLYREFKGRVPLPTLPGEACRMLIACQVGALFIIGTVSSVSFIPALMWASTALCVAFLRSGRQWT